MALLGNPGDQNVGAQGTPTDQVINLRQQGFDDNQVIQSLQKDGFSSNQVFNAMSQADVKSGVGGSAQPMPPPAPDMSMDQGFQQPPVTNMSQLPPEPPGGFQQDFGSDGSRIEEIAEAIIDEKWNVLVKDINKIIEWKEDMNKKISAFEAEISDLRNDFDSLHKAIINKIDDYDKNLSDVGSEIKAMNQIFQKVLPTFTENINTLSIIVNKLSSKKKIVSKE